MYCLGGAASLCPLKNCILGCFGTCGHTYAHTQKPGFCPKSRDLDIYTLWKFCAMMFYLPRTCCKYLWPRLWGRNDFHLSSPAEPRTHFHLLAHSLTHSHSLTHTSHLLTHQLTHSLTHSLSLQPRRSSRSRPAGGTGVPRFGWLRARADRPYHTQGTMSVWHTHTHTHTHKHAQQNKRATE